MQRTLRVYSLIIVVFLLSVNISFSTDLSEFFPTHDEQMAKIFNLIVVLEQRLTEIYQENEVLKLNVTALAETQNNFSRTNTKLEKELSALMQRVVSSPLDVWGNISSIRNDPSGRVESLTSLQQSVATLRDDLTYLHNEHLALQNKMVQVMESFNSSLQQQLQQQHGTLQNDNMLLQQQLATLQHDNMQMKDRLTRLEGEKQSLASSITSLTNKLRTIRGFTVQNAQAIQNIQHHQVVVFDQVTTNEGGRYQAQTGIFTADINGWYVFFFDIRVRYYNQLCWSELVKNNAAIVLTYGLSGGRYHDHSSESNMAVLHIQAGDHIWIRSSRDGDTSCGIDDHSSFSGLLLNAD